MAYKFQRGVARLSGSIVAEEGLNTSTTLDATGIASLDGGINVDDNFTVSAAGAVVAVGVNAGGAITGATTIAASSNATIEGIVSGAAGTFDALAGTSLALQNGGITAAGAIAGATTIDASGDLTVGSITMTGVISGSNFLDLGKDKLRVDGVAVTATAAELNLLDGVTFAADLLDDADADAARTTLGLGTIATQAANSVNIDGGAVDGITLGTNSAVTLAEVTQLTASHALITNLDVVTINSVTQTETTLEVADAKIVSALSASSANADMGGLQIGGGANDLGHASVLYDHSLTALSFNIGLNAQLHVSGGENNAQAALFPETDGNMDLGKEGKDFRRLYLANSGLYLNEAVVNATAAELNVLDGVNATLQAAELNLLDNNSAIGAAVGDLADTDGIIVEDGNEMKKVQLQSIKTYIGNGTAAVTSGSAGATLSKGINYFGNIGAAVAVTLPGATAPSVGDSVMIKAGSDCSGTNRLTINGYADHKIDNESSIALESPFAAVECVYVVSGSWRVF